MQVHDDKVVLCDGGDAIDEELAHAIEVDWSEISQYIHDGAWSEDDCDLIEVGQTCQHGSAEVKVADNPQIAFPNVDYDPWQDVLDSPSEVVLPTMPFCL